MTKWWAFLDYGTKKNFKRYVKKLLGICRECDKGVYLTHSLCREHLEVSNYGRMVTLRKARLKYVNRCLSCGKTLNEFFDEGHRNCIRCRERTLTHIKGV